jgi:hypothetical protein
VAFRSSEKGVPEYPVKVTELDDWINEDEEEDIRIIDLTLHAPLIKFVRGFYSQVVA